MTLRLRRKLGRLMGRRGSARADDGADRFRDAASARRAVTGVRGPWTFGLRPEALPAYLEERGLRLVKDMSADEYRTHTMPAPPPVRNGMNSSRRAGRGRRPGAPGARPRRRGTVGAGSRLLHPSS